MNHATIRRRSPGLVASLLFLAGVASAFAAPAGPPRVLILSEPQGKTGGGTTPVLRRILEDTGRFVVRVCEVPEGVTAGMLSGFDLVVVDATDPPAGSQAAGALADFVRAGKGLIRTNAALGGSGGSVGFLEVENARPRHPITVGLPGHFKVADAPAPLTPADGEDALLVVEPGRAPVLTALSLGKGRIVRMALGHDPGALQEPTFVRAFARAASWAIDGDVSIPDETGTTTPKAPAIRGLVITGGHFHEAAFFQLFADMPELKYLPIEQAEALRSDLKGKYDVVIFYDFEREADDAMKKHVREFVEAGKGVVVLHHALLNFQHWDWWCNEVVGGSYRLSNEGGKPSSAVKDAQDFYLTPKADHPITAGLAPFHLVDEAYRRMRFSEKVTPLLTTDAPASDPSVAWVGPGPSYRVVAIQLGHGQTAFGHPSYRALVHNAILWAAGRLK
ncbi:ThuA domain-containing protein [Aquisphaera insulae]|uniref:ThuA domain-containing protein n=1 Tax=Aquisphaera insulae TaxID=2712864 RepID=UPI0013EA5355|nr:ThuA domain-containing protein [Aquisphaera insulae]